MISSEESFIIRIRKGERKAMEELYDNYAPVLLGVALRYCSRREEAEDLLHESLIRIIKGVHEFKPSFEGAFEAWMRRITVNSCLSYIKRKPGLLNLESVNENTLGNVYEEADDSSSLPDVSPETIISMMQSLPAGYRTVLNLYVFEHLSHKEIAKELNISENTSKSQLSKARHYMKKQLEVMIKTAEGVR